MRGEEQSMDAHLQSIRDGVQAVCNRFSDDYWLARDSDGVFPHDFHAALAEAGWLGLTMPEAYGGANLGVSEAAVMMHTIAKPAPCQRPLPFISICLDHIRLWFTALMSRRPNGSRRWSKVNIGSASG